MHPFSTLAIALHALSINKLRSALTMLGIIIGVAAVIAMIAIGQGAQRRVAEHIQKLGANVIVVWPGSRTAQGLRLGATTAATLTEDDALAIAREVPGIMHAAPSIRGNAQVVAGNTNWATVVYGINPDYLEARGWSVADGRGFEPAESASAAKVALIGRTIVHELFGDADPIGRTMRIGLLPVTIVGTLAPKGQNAWGTDQDDVVFVPLATMRNRVQGQPTGRLKRVSAINIRVADDMSMSEAEEGIRALLRQRHRLQPGQDDDFGLRNLSELLLTQQASSQVLTRLLAAVSGISLLVGGIGIMNIMLVSVTERAREIGLRLAVGARGRDILLQFMVEATTLALIGGLVGIGCGVAVALLLGHFADWPTVLVPEAIVLAVGFAAAIGIFFGFYPARRAARLQPIEALRHE